MAHERNPTKNSNCLAGFQCPECGHEDTFKIAATTMVDMTDDGSDDVGDLEWDQKSYCECRDCGHYGTVGDFTGKPTPEAPSPKEFVAVLTDLLNAHAALRKHSPVLDHARALLARAKE